MLCTRLLSNTNERSTSFFLSFCNHTKARICTLNGKQVLQYILLQGYTQTIVKGCVFHDVSKIKMSNPVRILKRYQLLPTPKVCLGKHLSIRNQSLHNAFWIERIRDQLMINIKCRVCHICAL